MDHESVIKTIIIIIMKALQMGREIKRKSWTWSELGATFANA